MKRSVTVVTKLNMIEIRLTLIMVVVLLHVHSSMMKYQVVVILAGLIRKAFNGRKVTFLSSIKRKKKKNFNGS